MNKRLVAVIIACFATVFTAFSIRYGYGVLLPEMLVSLAISKTSAGAVYSSFFIVYTILSPILGLMADRYNPRIILTLFAAVLGSGTFLMAYASSVVEASLYFAIVGLGSSACWAPLMGLAQRWASTTRKGLTLALIDSGSSLGIMWVGAGVPLIAIAFGWPAGWMSLGVLGWLLAVINFFMIRERPADNGSQKSAAPKKSVGTIYRELLRNKGFWLIGLAYLLTGFSILVPFTFLSTYAVQELDFQYEVATRLLTVVGFAAMVGKLVLGSLSDKLGRLRILLLCKVLMAAGTFGMMYCQDFLTMASVTVVFSIGYGAVWAMYAALASDLFSKEYAGSIVGLWTVYLGVGSILSPVIAGWIADVTGTLGWAFLTATIGALIGFVLLSMAYKKYR